MEIPRRFQCHFCPSEFYFDRGLSKYAAELKARQAGWQQVPLEGFSALVWKCPDKDRHAWWEQKVQEWDTKRRRTQESAIHKIGADV